MKQLSMWGLYFLHAFLKFKLSYQVCVRSVGSQNNFYPIAPKAVVYSDP